MTMNVTIPANSTATVYVPAQKAKDVLVNGQGSGKADHVTDLRIEENRAVTGVGSGRFQFTSKINE